MRSADKSLQRAGGRRISPRRHRSIQEKRAMVAEPQVPGAIGRQIGARVEKALPHLNTPQAAPAEDDLYKHYVVPDDLVG
jgi:hypothetical protein